MTVLGHGYDDNVGAPAFRNMIINGGMNVAQRNTSVSSNTTGGYLTADRWTGFISSLGTWTQSIENDAPTGSGHRKSLKMLCTTANSSPSSGSYCQLSQAIEGQNLQHFANGTSSAKTYTLSFWVKSNVTGTYIAELSASNGRAVSLSYTISSSGVWEKKSLNFPADTISTIVNDNTVGIYLVLNLASGSSYTSGTLQTTWAATVNANRYVGQVNLASAISNYWQITGVQLEAGPVATPFEFEPFETTLRKCQRYFYRHAPTGITYMSFAYAGAQQRLVLPLPCPMRATANVSASGWAGGTTPTTSAINSMLSTINFYHASGAYYIDTGTIIDVNAEL